MRARRRDEGEVEREREDASNEPLKQNEILSDETSFHCSSQRFAERPEWIGPNDEKSD